MAVWTEMARGARWGQAVAVSLLLAIPANAQRAVRRDAAQEIAARARQAAEKAQRTFEFTRRTHLPLTAGGTPTCDVTVGRICYWDNNDDSPLPSEPERIASERKRLLHALASAAARAPADDWIAGQRVRYLVEAGELDQAVDAARACEGTPSWCAALRGLALHRSGDDTAANAAFDSALAAMSERDRCEWTDLSEWLDGKTASRYDDLDCAARDSLNARIWWLAQPLAMHPGRDVRAEFLSRRTMIRILNHAETPYTMSWGDDLATVLLRYGWPTSWAIEDDQSASLIMPMDRALIGHEPTPSFYLIPEDHAVDEPTAAHADEWSLDEHRAPTRYAPAYATTLESLTHQLARFRRGDSMLVVAAYDLGTDTAWRAHPLRAGLVLASAPESTEARRIVEQAHSHDALSVTVPRRPLLASLEVSATDIHHAARARYGVSPLDASSPLSDILLLVADSAPDDPEPSVHALLPAVRGATTVAAGDTVGLYWECYAPATPANPLAVRLRVEPTHVGWLHGLASALHLASKATPVSLAWSDAGRPDRSVGRILRLGLRDLPTGDYRIELSIAGNDTPRTTVSREITIVHGPKRE